MRPTALLLAALAAASVSLPLTASAEGFSISTGASTLGYTVEPAYRLNDHWGIRMPIAQGSYDFDGNAGDRRYSGALKSDAVGLLADYRPFSGGLRLSGGLIHTDYRANALSEEITFGSETSRIYANIEQKDKVSPMLAIGYDAKIGPARISAVAGGIFTSGFKVSGGQTGPSIADGEVDAELEKVRDEIDGLKSIPYVSLGVTFAF